MIVHCENFGPIKNGEIDINKDFLLFCGNNNSGKTYLSYFLYGFLNDNIKFDQIEPFIKFEYVRVADRYTEEPYYTEIEKEATISFSLEKVFLNNQEDIKKEFSRLSKSVLSSIFPNISNFDDTSFYIEFPDISQVLVRLYNSEHRASRSYNDSWTHVSFIKEPGKFLITFRASQPNKLIDNNLTEEIERLVNELTLSLILVEAQSHALHRCYCFPAERIALDIFNWDIINSRPAIGNDMQGHHAINAIQYSPAGLEQGIGGFRRTFPDTDKFYPLPVHNFLMRSSSYGFYQAGKGYLYDIGLDLESRLGVRLINEDFQNMVVHIGEADNIPLRIASSTIKALTSFIIYLKHESKINDAVFFDEPELGLHPSLQRKLAVTLAKMVHIGVRVIVSTHSDYMLREFNNLIMLNQQSEMAKKLRIKYSNIGYDLTSTLNPSRIGVYLFGEGTTKEVSVTESGFDVSSIDEVINEQNSIAEDIYFNLF